MESVKTSNNLSSKPIVTENKTESCVEDELECAVCLQMCVHPVRLPCSHIFCFLCVKGVANQSKRCAMCRQEIPADFLDNPILLKKIEEKEDNEYQWFYEGRNGWWRYDDRTSEELESAFKNGRITFEILLMDNIYVLDVMNMVQYRKNDLTKSRKIKRELMQSNKINCKGVAGILTKRKQEKCTNTGQRTKKKQKIIITIDFESDETDDSDWKDDDDDDDESFYDLEEDDENY